MKNRRERDRQVVAAVVSMRRDEGSLSGFGTKLLWVLIQRGGREGMGLDIGRPNAAMDANSLVIDRGGEEANGWWEDSRQAGGNGADWGVAMLET